MTPLRPRPLPPPESSGGAPLDVLVRDHPELLAPLRAAGLDPARVGVTPLRDAAPAAELEGILGMVAERTSWRER